jgi:iron complex transport system ATP-binding protein
MRAGRVVAQGPPADVMTGGLVEDVFAMPCRVIADPETGTPMVVPADRHRRRAARAAPAVPAPA